MYFVLMTTRACAPKIDKRVEGVKLYHRARRPPAPLLMRSVEAIDSGPQFLQPIDSAHEAEALRQKLGAFGWKNNKWGCVIAAFGNRNW